MDEKLRKENKSVLVTGAYGGMGYATVVALAKAGYTVYALDLRVKEQEENIIPIQADITDENSVIEAFNRVKEQTDETERNRSFCGRLYA